jgi:Dihydrodipicolinate synthetase family
MRNTISGVGGSLTALVTPFHDTQVDWTALSRLSERQIDRGTAALIVCGSTGASLIPSEYARAVRTVADTAAGRVPVIAGCTAMATTAAIALGTLCEADAGGYHRAYPRHRARHRSPSRALRRSVAGGRGHHRRHSGAAA